MKSTNHISNSLQNAVGYNANKLLLLIIVLAVILCFMNWNKSADVAEHHLTENKFNRHEESDGKENPNPYQQAFCDLDR